MRSLFLALRPFALLFFTITTATRALLIARVFEDVATPWWNIPGAMLIGFGFDIVVFSYLSLLFLLYRLVLPKRLQGTKTDRLISYGLLALFSGVMLFQAFAEQIFWTEFGTRFNFIAVDYLIYTQEVIGNIAESYPLPLLLCGIGALIALSVFLLRKPLAHSMPLASLRTRASAFGVAVLITIGLYLATDIRLTQFTPNMYANELAANGTYNLFWAFGHNEIDYQRFYARENQETMNEDMRHLLHEKNMPYANTKQPDDMTRIVHYPGPEKRYNVVMVVMESLSGKYMRHLGGEHNITPNLDALADKGLFFTNLYATGTRTVRGLEALTLSVPPTPGQSIIRRPGNENLFSTGFIFKDRGYDTRFIYGGHGYFDNMNYFFAHNGFDIVDRSMMSEDEVHFSNVWGVSDEDLFAKVIKESDASYQNGKPFFHMVMTTSNHRPYTYPAGKIDIAGGREGGVKYADYAIGQLIANAEQKPWFKDTIFIFVSDHTAGSAGKTELDPDKYHIPCIFYAPHIIKPARFTNMASQIDVAPITLGMLNFTYRTRFLGEDLLHDDDEVPHAFISNYQKVALMRGDEMVVLSPRQQVEGYRQGKPVAKSALNAKLVDDAITYYQYSSNWKTLLGRINTIPTKEEVNTHAPTD